MPGRDLVYTIQFQCGSVPAPCRRLAGAGRGAQRSREVALKGAIYYMIIYYIIVIVLYRTILCDELYIVVFIQAEAGFKS